MKRAFRFVINTSCIKITQVKIFESHGYHLFSLGSVKTTEMGDEHIVGNFSQPGRKGYRAPVVFIYVY
jgi:hypothetical protein